MEYRGVELKLTETSTYSFNSDSSNFVVENPNGLVFVVSSRYGQSIATTPTQALDGAKKQIDSVLGV